jgi:hypothetical protein
MDLLASLVLLAIWLVVVAVVIGVLIWAAQTIWPQAPPIVGRGLLVLGVLIGLYLILAYFVGALPHLPAVRPRP